MKEFNKNITDSFNNEGLVLFERMTGSRMYGTSYEKGEHPFLPDYVSDYDYRGLFMISPLHKLNMPPFNLYDATLKLDSFDSEFYEIQKFFFEAEKNNPNYMDLLFGDTESLIGTSLKGDFILEHKNDFLSNKIADSFSGYANAQLYRIKNHNKWFTLYPNIYDVESTLIQAYENNDCDHNMISNLFSGSLAYSITGENSNARKEMSNLNQDEMLEKYFKNKLYSISKYMKPKAINYIKLQNNLGFDIRIDDNIEDYLKNNATFRTSNKSLYFIFDGGNGIFSNDGNIQPRASITPKSNEEIRYILSLDINGLTKGQDEIKSLWDWKINRNETRSSLERKFGYDVKHGMHTYRLLDSAIDILNNGTYNPRLSGVKLQNAKDILAGKWSYEELLNESKIKLLEISRLKKLKLLPPDIDHKHISNIYKEVLFS